MLNVSIVEGNLCSDPEVRVTANGHLFAGFTLASKRNYYKDKADDTDFLNCIAFGKTAEFIQNHCTKGMRIIIQGRSQSRNYEGNDGKIHTTYEILVSEVNFVIPRRRIKLNSDSIMIQ